MKLVTIITSTTGRQELRRAIESVQRQTYSNIQHFIAVDGPKFHEPARAIVREYPGLDVLYLPYPTRQWGTRIHAALPHLSRGEFIQFLDDDNHLEPDHVEKMVQTIGARPWAYSLRNLAMDGMFVARDHCESLGYLHPTWDSLRAGNPSHHIDTGCFFLRRDVALQLSWNWAPISFEHPGHYTNDRLFFAALHKQFPGAPCSGLFTFNYEISSDVLGFILDGNRFMAERYKEGLPWLRHQPEESGTWNVKGPV